MNKETLLKELFEFSEAIRYVAIYTDEDLVYRQRNESLPDASSSDTDRYEELLVNPTLLTLASQRGNIDCGGLDYLIIRYGNFTQVVKQIPGGHISICLDKKADLNIVPQRIFEFYSSLD